MKKMIVTRTQCIGTGCLAKKNIFYCHLCGDAASTQMTDWPEIHLAFDCPANTFNVKNGIIERVFYKNGKCINCGLLPTDERFASRHLKNCLKFAAGGSSALSTGFERRIDHRYSRHLGRVCRICMGTQNQCGITCGYCQLDCSKYVTFDINVAKKMCGVHMKYCFYGPDCKKCQTINMNDDSIVRECAKWHQIEWQGAKFHDLCVLCGDSVKTSETEHLKMCKRTYIKRTG